MQGKKGIIVDPCPICRSKFTYVVRKNSHKKYCSKLLNCEIDENRSSLNKHLSLCETCHCTKYLSVFSPNAGKYGPEKTPYLDTFHAVCGTSQRKANGKVDLCGKCFENLSKLVQHKLTQNVKKSFICPECGKEFLRKDNMLQHVKNIH